MNEFLSLIPHQCYFPSSMYIPPVSPSLLLWATHPLTSSALSHSLARGDDSHSQFEFHIFKHFSSLAGCCSENCLRFSPYSQHAKTDTCFFFFFPLEHDEGRVQSYLEYLFIGVVIECKVKSCWFGETPEWVINHNSIRQSSNELSCNIEAISLSFLNLIPHCKQLLPEGNSTHRIPLKCQATFKKSFLFEMEKVKKYHSCSK